MAPSYQIMWFKRDLRLHDHAAFAGAAADGAVIPLYIVEPDLWQQPDTAQRHWHFIHDSLHDLDKQLGRYGGRLIIRVGEALAVLEDMRQRLGHFTLWSHEETGNSWTYQRDIAVAKWCQQHSITWHETSSHGVIRRLKNRDTWSAQRDARMSAPVVSLPVQVQFATTLDPGILPSKDDSLCRNTVLGTTQQGGRKNGIKVLESFLKERGKKYMLTISKPGISARHCSRLSAHIAYGTLSVREIEQATKRRIQNLKNSPDTEGHYFARHLSAFLSRLAWRCHFVQKLEQQPSIETHCMHPAFEGMREPFFNEGYLKAWQQGQTGYPIIDACMRSLIENGWLTFRMRAMLVSFASYDLWLDWRQTAPYLAQLFTDYEPGIHYSQFQMQSGVTGINAVRVYNPIKQGIDHDTNGRFIRRYVPELKDVPDSFIHQPWRWPDAPCDYPSPVIDHDMAIKKAREAISARWKTTSFRDQAQHVHRKLGSRSRQPARNQSKKRSKDSTQLDLFKE